MLFTETKLKDTYILDLESAQNDPRPQNSLLPLNTRALTSLSLRKFFLSPECHMKDPTRNPEEARNNGEALFALVKRLYPICRSITGNGVRETLQIIKEVIPIEVREVPSGTSVLDWNVPDEWNICDAWIKGPDGRKIVDFQQSNLHVVSYSIPFRDTLSLVELKKHLFSMPDHPELGAISHFLLPGDLGLLPTPQTPDLLA